MSCSETCDINPRSFRQRFTIESNDGEGTFNDYGESTEDWQPLDNGENARGQIETLSGLELIRARQLVAEATHRATTHYRRGVNTQQRLRWIDEEGSTRILHISHKDNVEQANRFLRLTCTEEIAGST